MSKRYIITDPCYVLPENIWSEIGEKVYHFNDSNRENIERDYNQENIDFTNYCTEALQEFSGDYKAIASRTGFGDWSNNLHGEDVIKADFFADSGMVCAVELTDTIKEAIARSNESLPEESWYRGMAILETDKDVSFEMDTSNPEWTIVLVKDKATGFIIARTSDVNEEI